MALPTIQEIEQDERFKTLSYEDQVKVRTAWFTDWVREEPGLAQLPREELEQVYRKAVFAEPVFEGDISEYGVDKLAVGRALRERLPGAKNALWQELAGDAWFGRLGFVRLLQTIAGKAAGTADEDWGAHVLELGQGFTAKGGDDDKAKKWLEAVTAQEGTQGIAQFGTILGTMSGLFTDMIVGRALTLPLWNPVKNATYGKLMGAVIGKTPTTQWLLTSAAPAAIRNARDGVVGVMSEYLRDSYNERQFVEKTFPEQAVWAAKRFGEYWLADMLLYGFINLGVPFLKNVFKVFSGKFNAADIGPGSQATVDEITRSLISGQDLPPELWAVMSPEARKGFTGIQAKMAVVGRLEEFPDKDTMNMLIGLGKGYDLAMGKTGWTLTDIASKKLVGTFASTEEAIAGAFHHAHLPVTAVEPMSLVGKQNIRVREVISGKVKGEIGDVADDLASLLTPDPATGRLDKERLKLFRDSVFGMGKKKPVLEFAFVPEEEYFKTALPFKVKEGVHIIPDKISTSGRELQFAGELTENLAGIVGTLDPAAVRGLRDTTRMAIGGYSHTWLHDMAKRADARIIYESSGRTALQLADGTRLGFQSELDLARHLYATGTNWLEELPTIKEYLKGRLGIEVRQARDGHFLLKQGSNVRGSYDNVEEMVVGLRERGWMPDMPERMAPSAVVIDPYTKRASLGRNIFVGDGREASKQLGQYTSYKRQMESRLVAELSPKEGGKVLKGKSAVTLNEIERYYELEVPELGFRKRFGSKEAARDFLDGSTKSFSDLASIGHLKGLEITPNQGHWLVRDALDADAPIRIARTGEELKEVIRSTPGRSDIAKELSTLDDAFVKSLFVGNEDLYWEMQGVAPNMKELFTEADFQSALKRSGKVKSTVTSRGAFYRPMDKTMENIAREIENPEVFRSYTSLREASKQARGLAGRAHARMNDVFKGLTKEQDHFLISMMEMSDARWKAKALAEGIEVTPDMLRARDVVKELFDQSAELFGINPSIMLERYFPRIREFIVKNKISLNPSEMALKALASEFTTGLPKEVRFLAQNMRVSDLVEWVDDASALDVVKRYFTRGYKNLIMKESYTAFKDVVGTVAKSNMEYGALMMRYGEQLMGMDIDLQSAVLKKLSVDASTEFFQRLGKATGNAGLSRKQVDDVLSAMHGMVVTSTMAFRPGLALRNMMQIYATLAPRVGIGTVNKAMVAASQMGADRTAQILRDMGELTQNSPYLDMVTTRMPFQRAAEYGMRQYKGADVYNRVVTFLAMEERFADAMARWQKIGADGTRYINEKQFVKLAGIGFFSAEEQARLVDVLKTHGPKAAMVESAKKMIHETQFAYMTAELPITMQGMWGKLFGAYGTYPVYYLENVKRGLVNGGPGGAAVFAGRLALISAAFYTTFEKVMGISSSAFLPWGQSTFAGGPIYEMMNRSLNALGTDYKADQARQNLLKDWGRLLIPGSTQYRSVRRAFGAAGEGDTYEAMVHLLGLPFVGWNQ